MGKQSQLVLGSCICLPVNMSLHDVDNVMCMSVFFPQDGDTPLHNASSWGFLDVVKALLTCRETSLSVRNKVSIVVVL